MNTDGFRFRVSMYLALGLIWKSAAVADGPLFPGAHYAAGNGPRSVAIGDLDGDQAPDLAVANLHTDNVSVLLNQKSLPGDIDGDDYWLFVAALPSCAGDPQYNPAADLDGDGCVTLVDYTIWLELYAEANPPPASKPSEPEEPDQPGDTASYQQVAEPLSR